MPGIAYSILGLTLLAPTLGGCSTVWAQASITLGTGLLLTLAPPKRSLTFLPNICLVTLLLLALIAFLPARWFPPQPVRVALSHLGITLAQTRSPQPWLTLQSMLLCLLGTAWT